MVVPSQKPAPGARFGRYRVLGEVASGGMAHVFLAEIEGPQGFRKRCVLKTMNASLAADRSFVKMFVEEAGVAARFEHDNVVRIFDFGVNNGQYFIAMEHIAGRTLRQIARRYRELGRRPDLWFLVRVAMGVCDGLDYVHNYSDDGVPLRLVHRDVSPENVMVSFNGTVKLLDFGVAHSSVSTAASGKVVGKYRYMAPERLDGTVSGPAGDIYSVGMILYELIAGGSPFTGEEVEVVKKILEGPASLDTIAPDVPASLRTVIARAIGPLSRRFESAGRLKRHLRRSLAEFAPDASERSLADELGDLFSSAVDLPSNVRAANRSRHSDLPPLPPEGEPELPPLDIEVAIDELFGGPLVPEAPLATPTMRNDIDALRARLEDALAPPSGPASDRIAPPVSAAMSKAATPPAEEALPDSVPATPSPANPTPSPAMPELAPRSLPSPSRSAFDAASTESAPPSAEARGLFDRPSRGSVPPSSVPAVFSSPPSRAEVTSSRPEAASPFSSSPRESKAPAEEEGPDPFRVPRLEPERTPHPFGVARIEVAPTSVWGEPRSSAPASARPAWSPADWGISREPAPSSEEPTEHLEASKHFDRGLAAMRDGQLALAEIEWERAVALDPDNKSYSTNLRRLREKRGGSQEPGNG